MSQLSNRGEVKGEKQHGEEERGRTAHQGYEAEGSGFLLDVNAGNNIVKCDMLSSMHEEAKRKFRKMFQDDDNRMYDEKLGLNIYIKNIWIYINLMCTFTIHDLILISRSFKNTEIIYDDVVFSGKEDGSLFKDGQSKRKNSLFIYFQNYKIRKNVVKIFLQKPYAVCFIHKNGSVHVHGALTLRKGLLILIKVIKRLKYKTFWTYLSGCDMGVPHQGVELQQEGATVAGGVAPCNNQIVHTEKGGSNFLTCQQNGGGSISGESTPQQSIVEESTPEDSITGGDVSPDDGDPTKNDKAKVSQTIRFCETVIEELRGKIKKYRQGDWEQVKALPEEGLCQGGEKNQVPSESSEYYQSGGCKGWTSEKPHGEVPSQLGREQMDVHLNEGKLAIQMEEKTGGLKVDSPKGSSSEEYKSEEHDQIANVSESPPPHLCDHARDSSELTHPNHSTTHFKPSNTQADGEKEFSGIKKNDRYIERQHPGEMGPFSNQFDQSALQSKKCIYQFDTYRRWKYITRNDITFDMDHFYIKQLVSVFNVKLRHFDISKIYKYKEFKNILTDINNIIYIRIDHSLLSKLIQQDSLDHVVQNNFTKGYQPNIHPCVRTVLLFSSGNVVLYACRSRLEVRCVSRFIVNTLRRNNNIAL
ncbi:hypothetical protein AK88_03315 [Plasmodium fragile]|uniref:Uncharacterized protein n=1 Tax=Plasmodium fragile TaxID=5857 RepID=A0A0D9QMS4_PLAFR|nr:uncharacterized protein AK88_03315 [Plasmodium fragile]KJP87031.1 hypothetical protein AK88_03315 [Plasmodium fragile]